MTNHPNRSKRTTRMHCGMCEHDWSARTATPKRCPSCGSDEFETAEQALITKAHNHRAMLDPFQRQLFDNAQADALNRGLSPSAAADLAVLLSKTRL